MMKNGHQRLGRYRCQILKGGAGIQESGVQELQELGPSGGKTANQSLDQTP